MKIEIIITADAPLFYCGDDLIHDTDTDEDSSDQLNSPELDDSGKPKNRAISNAKQAHAFGRRVIDDNKDRNDLNAEINDRYSGKLPFDGSRLKATGQGWRTNMSSKPMAPPVDRAVTQAVDFVNSSPVLTNARLPGVIVNAKEKTDDFRQVTTSLIRHWSGWNDFINTIFKEDFLIGYASGAWLDDDWRPRFYRSDEIFFPDGVGQTPAKVPAFVIRRQYLIHEFYELIGNKSAAEAAGYDYKNCIEAINEASVDTMNYSGDDERKRSDALREMNLSDSYANGSKTVNVLIVVCAEVNGKCSHWMVTEDEGTLLRHVDELYSSMSDVLGMMTISVGNGCYYGSMGMGRVLINVATALDRARCMAMDQMYLSGLLIISTKGKSLNTIQLRVQHPFIFISDEEATVQDAQIRFDHAAFQAIDARLQSLIEELAGVYIPRKVDQGGQAITATQAQIDASREDAVKRGVFNRMWYQLSEIIYTMQRKIYSEENLKEARRQYDKYKEEMMIEEGGLKGSFVFFRSEIYNFLKKIGDTVGVFKKPETDGLADTEAVEAIINLFSRGLSEKEILTLADSPASDMSQEASVIREQAAMQWLEGQQANPLIDQNESMRYRANVVLGSELAERVLMTEDKTNSMKAAEWRQQIMELTSIMAHQAVPVADTDDHAVHQQAIRQNIGQALMETPIEAVTPDYLNAMKIAADHHLAHTQKRIMLGESRDNMAEELQFDEMARKMIDGLEQQLGGSTPDMPFPVELSPGEQAAANQSL